MCDEGLAFSEAFDSTQELRVLLRFNGDAAAMKEINRTIIPIKSGFRARALCWHGDELIDWAGIIRYQLDGTSSGPDIIFAFPFDHAVSSPSGEYVVLYQQLGTKGLILKGDDVVREINRSFYHAHVYEYPVVLFTLPDGREVIAHCPDEYNVIQIEEVESGNRLTARSGDSDDFFHSRLQVSSDGRYLLSAGWIWHPWDTFQVFDLTQVLQSPESLDRNLSRDLSDVHVGEIHAAAFNGTDQIVFAGEAGEDGIPLLGIYSIQAKAVVNSLALDSPAGTLMPVGDVAVSFYESPKLLDLATGKVLYRWPELSTGLQNSSIIGHLDRIPPIALDPVNRRFAVADSENITVVQLG